MTQTPRIGMGRVPLSVHILAPSMRPVQVTQDLENFWKEHYPKIKSELKRKYPKHEWAVTEDTGDSPANPSPEGRGWREATG